MLKTNDIKEKVRSVFSTYLTQHGHRKTPERFAILDEVYTFTGHFDVEQLFGVMKQKNYRVSRATLYNTIDLLQACNLVRKHNFGHQQAQFEKSHSNGQHDHIILMDSGRVLEFCDPRISNIQSTLEEIFGIEIMHHSLHFYAREKEKNP